MDESLRAEIDVNYVAGLARIELAPEETARLQAEIEGIVRYVKLLNEADVSQAEPTAHATQVTNVFRDDEPGECLSRSEVMANAPETMGDEAIRVPPVMGDEAQGGP